MTIDDELRATLLDLEERFWIEGGGDPAFWASHFADDGLVTLPIGIMDKPGVVEAMGQAAPWEHVEMTQVDVRGLGPDTALVTYRATASRAGDDAAYEAFVGSVYAPRGARWLLTFHQQSPTS